jgi:predicted PurR-regulated permease PerM
MKGYSLEKAVYILLFLFFFFAGLIYAKPFLMPVLFASLLAMLLLPLSNWLVGKGINKALSIVICILIFLSFFVLLGWLISWQVSDLSKNSRELEENLMQKLKQLQFYISNSFGISPEQQEQMVQKQRQSGGGMSGFLSGVLAGVGGFLTNLLIVLVYIFLFLFYRDHLKTFIIKLVPKSEEAKTKKIIADSSKVVQKYLTGLFLMIIGLWIMYSIGFTIAGVKNAIFFAILCGLLEIIPFVGNLAGNAITILVAVAQGGDITMILGILITYALVQFIQSYILEPLVVGSEVNLHPLFTIAGIVLGELVWGIPGMILAIPIMGITKIICDNVESLKPFGYLIGEEKKKGDKNLKDKIKGMFKSDSSTKSK